MDFIEVDCTPRIVIAKPSTPEMTWPSQETSGCDYFTDLENTSSDEIRPDAGIDAYVEFALADLIKIRFGESEISDFIGDEGTAISIFNSVSQITAVDCSINEEVSLYDGFGGSGDGAGDVYGCAACIISAHEPMTIKLPVTALDELEFGNIGKPLEASLANSRINDQYEEVYARNIRMERSIGIRSLECQDGKLWDFIKSNNQSGFNAIVVESIESLQSRLVRYAYWQYRYDWSGEMGRLIDSAHSLSDMHAKLNRGDISWADNC
jgi:hypothetical protein